MTNEYEILSSRQRELKILGWLMLHENRTVSYCLVMDSFWLVLQEPL